MSLLVESIVKEIVVQQDAEKQQRLQKYQDLLGEARIQLQVVLEQVTGLYETLKPFIQEDYKLCNEYRDLAVDLHWTIQSDELQLAPMTLGLRHPRQGYHTAYISVAGGSQVEFAKIQQAIAEARQEYLDWKKRADEKFLDERKYKFNFRAWNEETMQTAYDELVARFPERQAEFAKWRQDWYDGKAESDRWDEEHKQTQEKETQAKEDYLSQMISYYQLQREVKERNDAKMGIIQVAFDQSFDAWQLTYALVAHDEEEPYIETNTRWVTSERPDATGHWMTFGGDQIKYFYPVSIQKFSVFPSDQKPGLYKTIIRSRYGIQITTHPNVDEAEVDRHIAEMALEKLPEQPERPSILNWCTGEYIERRAWKTVYEPESLTEDDIDF